MSVRSAALLGEVVRSFIEKSRYYQPETLSALE